MEPRGARARDYRPPFPVYEQLVDDLLAAHRPAAALRDATVAHALGTCAGYAASMASIALVSNTTSHG